MQEIKERLERMYQNKRIICLKQQRLMLMGGICVPPTQNADARTCKTLNNTT